jgi:hypothetical protein
VREFLSGVSTRSITFSVRYFLVKASLPIAPPRSREPSTNLTPVPAKTLSASIRCSGFTINTVFVEFAK